MGTELIVENSEVAEVVKLENFFIENRFERGRKLSLGHWAYIKLDGEVRTVVNKDIDGDLYG